MSTIFLVIYLSMGMERTGKSGNEKLGMGRDFMGTEYEQQESWP